MATQNLPSAKEPTGLLVHLLAVMAESKRTRVKELLQSGLVHVNGVSVTRHDSQIGPSDTVEVREERAAPTRELPFEVLYEDAHLMAINKPNGLLTVGNKHEKARTVYALANRSLLPTRERAFIVHRLDLYTSGVLLLAKTEEAQAKIMGNWKAAKKVYHAVVEGVPTLAQRNLTHYLREDEQLVVHAMDTPSRGAHKATMSYRVLGSKSGRSLLKVDLETGKKNQIRAQLTAIGHPICGDSKYGATTNPLGRLGLHASSISIPHPKTGARLTVQAPLPEGFRI